MIALSASQFANKMVKEMMSEAIEVEAIAPPWIVIMNM
jgi:hypothetical protein